MYLKELHTYFPQINDKQAFSHLPLVPKDLLYQEKKWQLSNKHTIKNITIIYLQRTKSHLRSFGIPAHESHVRP